MMASEVSAPIQNMAAFRRLGWLPRMDKGCWCCSLETFCKVFGYFSAVASLCVMLGLLVVVSVGGQHGDSFTPRALVLSPGDGYRHTPPPLDYPRPPTPRRGAAAYRHAIYEMEQPMVRTPDYNVIYQGQYSQPEERHGLSPLLLRIIWIMTLIFEGFVCFLASIIFLMGFYQRRHTQLMPFVIFLHLRVAVAIHLAIWAGKLWPVVSLLGTLPLIGLVAYPLLCVNSLRVKFAEEELERSCEAASRAAGRNDLDHRLNIE
ncbi:uncharacterized protein LOC117652441 isoform X3 [Thrips palmi]|uniref:Uncharacterized protein LOC117652441 isoform X3 n=1 Tax=Thrips palmi TaxID=161013 RepID=A0A6P9A5T6_THRPL|nr:uncharacterized protein LOC117652441 isoform X3 [Thrips palmi]